MTKFLTLLMIGFVSYGAPAKTVQLGEMERNDLYGTTFFTWYNANQRCLQKGLRLPTVREYAELSAAMGSQGIRETEFPEVTIYNQYPKFEITHPGLKAEAAANKQAGYHPIYRRDSTGGTVVDFYFNYQGYQAAPGYTYNWLWTSSQDPSHPAHNIHLLDGREGSLPAILSNHLYGPYAVRCVLAE